MQHPRSLTAVALALTLGLAACASKGGSSGGEDPDDGGAGGQVGGAGGKGGAGKGGTDGGEAGVAQPPPRVTLEPGQAMSCEGAGQAVSTQHIEAECALGVPSGCKGSQQGTRLENNDTTVGYVEGGDYLAYEGVLLDGVTTLNARYAKGTSEGKIEIRLDSATGTLIGTWTPASTGDWNTWKEGSVALTASKGTHTLYLVAAGSSLGIVSLDWIELGAGASSAGGTPTVFHMNQIGFDTLGGKHAVVEGPADLTRFFVVDSDGKAVWCGDLKALSFSDWGSSNSFYSVDFTGLTRAGTYRLQAGSSASKPFTVADNRLAKITVPAALGYFKASRADDADVWAADAKVPLLGTGQTLDVRGGWYDAAGDISKYLSHLSYANYLNPQQIPLVAWGLAWVYDQPTAAALGADAVQAEALWGADYLLRVLDPTGFFYMNVFDRWSGDMGARTICSFEGPNGAMTNQWQSALREGGGMSIAALARIARWKVKGSFSADEYLAGAEKAFAHLNTEGVKYTDDGKENVIDDYTGLLAASELYATTQKSIYLDAARARATSLAGRLSSEGYFIADGASRPFWHASDAGLPVVALVRYTQVETDGSKKGAALQAVQKHLDYLVRVTQAVTNPYGYARQHVSSSRASFFIPHDNETGYWWQGENARLGSLAAAAAMGAEALQASGPAYLDLLRFAGTQMDWLFGANPYDLCFLHGSGDKNPPKYCGDKAQGGTLAGGMANGITGRQTDGSGIQWGGSPGCGDDWRWVEQWLPHSTWAMVAATALAR